MTEKAAARNKLRAFLNPDHTNPLSPLLFGAIAAVLAAIVVGLLRVVNVRLLDRSLAEFLYLTQYGYFYIYNFCALAELVFLAVFFPDRIMFRELGNNRWYYLTRMGFSGAELVSARLRDKLLCALCSYVFGALLGTGACFALGLDFYINGFLALIFFGIVNVILMLLCLLAVSSLTGKATVLRIFALVYAAALAACLYFCGCFNVASRYELAVAVSSTMYLDGIGFMVFAAVLAILMMALIYTCARDKSAFYSASEPKTAIRDRMGISKNAAVVAAGKNNTTRTITQGAEVKNRKEERKEQTLMLSLGEINKNEPRAQQRKPVEKEKPSAVRVVLAVLLAVLCVAAYAASAGCYLLKDVTQDSPKQLAGFCAARVVEGLAPEGAAEGDLVLFTKNDVSGAEIGSLVLYGDKLTQGVVTATGENMTIKSALGTGSIAASEIKASGAVNIGALNYFTTNGITGLAIPFGAAVLLTGLFALSLIAGGRRDDEK